MEMEKLPWAGSLVCTNQNRGLLIRSLVQAISFHGLMILIATAFSPLIAYHCFHNGYVEKLSCSSLERILCGVLVERKSRKAWIGALPTGL